tara:strand:+ start:22 stop:177 length:156 start_codon:yes stop_codon:yes gene_type:complete
MMCFSNTIQIPAVVITPTHQSTKKNNNINPISLLKKGVVEKHVIILRAPIS